MPVWAKKVLLGDVFRNDELTFEQQRDAIVVRLRQSGWITMAGGLDSFHGMSLDDLFEQLGETADVDEFDQVWDQIYDEADSDRVWIDLHARPESPLRENAPALTTPAADGGAGAPSGETT